MIVYGIVMVVEPQAERLSSYTSGRWETGFSFDWQEAEQRARLFNEKRNDAIVGCVSYVVEAYDEESPERPLPCCDMSLVRKARRNAALAA